MTKKKWDSKTKAKIVLEGVKGRRVAEICNDYHISQSQYYTWRDQFFSNIELPFETKKASFREERLKAKNEQLKSLVGELTFELKKIEEEAI